jgi:NAD(P)H-hydrate epimerase
LSSSALPQLTSRQVKEVDALAQERFGISVEWLMEAAGWQVATVCCMDAGRLNGAAARELEALKRIGVHVSSELRLDGASAVVDAIFGTGLSRQPQGRFAEWIDAINSSRLRVIAVDVPSGLDADSGVAYAPCVRADTTITLGLPKPGLLEGDGPRLSGEVWVADIGVPLEVYAAIGLAVPADLFAQREIVRL